MAIETEATIREGDADHGVPVGHATPSDRVLHGMVSPA